MSRKVEAFFDKKTFTVTYIVFDEDTRDALIIDPVLDYDSSGSVISQRSVNKLVEFTKKNELKVHYILESHAHADHLSGADSLKEFFPEAKVAISKEITKVQDVFKGLYNLETFEANGSQFDLLLEENEKIQVGSFEFETLFTSGHTPACASFLIDDMVFTGDALFMPDFGTGRCDFPAGSAEDLYDSVANKLYKLPDETKVFTGHDYQPGGREVRYETTIGESKKSNVHLKSDTPEEEFISFRKERDATLSAPKLLLPSIQVNINAGKLPKHESNGTSYLKIPVRS